MILPETIRKVIADRIIRIIAPAIIAVAIIAIVAILLFSDQQYHRLLTALVAIIFSGFSWIIARRGKPLIGIKYIILCFIFTSLTGVFFSGGIQAPIYSANLAFITIVVILYGLRGGVIYAICMLAVGGLAVKLEVMGLLPAVNEPPPFFLLLHHSYMMFLAICFILIPVRFMLESLSASKKQSSELEKAATEKQQAQEELQSILDKTPDIIYRLDSEGNITYISSAVKHYGYKPEELIGTPIVELTPRHDRHVSKRKLAERRTGGRGTRGFEARLLVGPHMPEAEKPDRKKDSWATFHVFSDGLYSNSTVSPNSFIGTQGIAHDISKLKSIEEQMAYLASVVEQAAEDVLITDPHGIITYVNPKFEEITGYSSQEALGKTPRILRSSKHEEQFYKEIWQTITSGQIWKGHIWNRTKSGQEILQDVTIKPIFDSTGNISGYASVRRDITRQHELEDQIRQSQKMEAIGTLAGGIAHDFNNILSGIIGYADLARYDVEDSPETLQKIDNIISAGKRATDLVGQILSFSRSQRAAPQPMNPQTIAREVLKLLRASLPSNIEIVQQIQSKSKIYADPVNIHQILMNLCTNAGHAMRSSGGVLTVAMEDLSLDAEEAQNYVDLTAGKYIKISVKDTGPGIAKELQERIFTPFFTTKIKGEGTGMGLSVVHGIVKDLGGEVILHSHVGQGATFQVFLPIIDETDDIAALVTTELLPRGTERILFVDDEVMQADLAKRSLGRFGYNVTVFTGSQEALDNFQSNSEDYDLIITDMTMPDLTGDVLTRKIHQIRPEIPVIMCTGFSEIMDAEQAEVLNIKALLYKPVVKKDLLETVRRVLDESSSQA